MPTDPPSPHGYGGTGINFADVGAIRQIVQNCRTRDRAEVEALYGLRATLQTVPQWAGTAVLVRIFDLSMGYRTEPVAFVAAHEVTPRTVQLSMLATEEWPRVAPQVIRWARREAMPRLLSLGYRRAEVRSIEGHRDALRFLDCLGFQLEGTAMEYGRNGEHFHILAWRSKDHVFQPENSRTTQASAA